MLALIIFIDSRSIHLYSKRLMILFKSKGCRGFGRLETVVRICGVDKKSDRVKKTAS